MVSSQCNNSGNAKLCWPCSNLDWGLSGLLLLQLGFCFRCNIGVGPLKKLPSSSCNVQRHHCLMLGHSIFRLDSVAWTAQKL